MKAILQVAFGDPDVLRFEEVDDPVPGEGQVHLDVHVAGVHLVDTSIRRGTSFGAFPAPSLPFVPGREVAGVVDGVGPGTDPIWIGWRVVVHLGMANGGYASAAVADASALFALPDHVAFSDAIAMVGTGRTALGILDVAEPAADDVALVTGAAGGIGTLLIQAIREVGGRVVAVATSEAKTVVARVLGADVVVDAAGDWPAEVRAALDGRAVTLALDGVGGDLGRAAFELVAPGGRMVLYGYASGRSMPLSADDLYRTGVTVSAAIGPRLLQRPGGIQALAERALVELASGRLVPVVHPPFALADAAEAHRAIEARETIGKVVLVP
jgi:NADPH2:quinone reductase